MKTLFVTLVLACVAFHGVTQNITNYTFAASSGSFNNLSGAILPVLSGGNTDEGYVNDIPIGFDFWYMGTRYTTVSVSTNGWMTLGASITDPIPVNNLTSGGLRPALAVLWDDLAISPATKVGYLTTGTVGNRVLTLQCQNVKWQNSASGNTLSFQVKLYEGTGKIEYIYQQQSGSASSPSASIGITAAGTGSGQFLSVNNLGTSASSTAEASVTSKPLSGAIYTFTPLVPAAPASLIVSSVSSSSITLNWSDMSSNDLGFVIYKSTDGVNYSFVSQIASGITTSVQSGLTASTTYYWKVYAVSEGGLSLALSGTQATTCVPPGAPSVTSPVNYCLNASATQLTATGTNLAWGATSGSVGGTTTLATTTYVDNLLNNKKTTFATTAANTVITNVEYYIPSYQSVFGLILSIYNNSGSVIATSTTSTTLTAGPSNVRISVPFNYTIAAAGTYSIGVSSGLGNIGSDSPSFPITESTGTINVTGSSPSGYRCFNNIQFSVLGSSTAPTPSTSAVGTSNYTVTQTIGGCMSAPATIAVNINTPNISQVPTSNLTANYKFNGNASDQTGNDNGTLQGSPSSVADRFNMTNRAYSFNGSSQYISTANAYTNPTDFTISIWFKTATATGGKLIGFGSSQTGQSGQSDRHLYMNNAGQVYFGIYSGSVFTINSPLSYNDNNWHLATATLSGSTGMALYIDGALVSSNTSATLAENSTGYWRIGYDNMNGWTSQPTSFYFNGILDDALIYSRAINATEVATLYNSPDGAGNNGPVCVGSTLTLSATSLSGATYAWSGPNGFTSTSQNPTLSYSLANAGTYSVSVTGAGCTTTAYTNVVSSTNAGQWTGNTSTDWATASNWCTGVVPTASTDVTIPSGAMRMPSISSSVTCKNLTINSGATLTTTSAGTLNIAGTLTNNGTMANNGTTNFNGTSGQQTFSGVSSFNNLTLSNTNGLLLPSSITVANNVTLTTGILSANNYNLSVGGNWVNNYATTAFTGGTGTVTFNGASAQSIGGTFTTTFNNLATASVGSSVTLLSNTAVSGNLSVLSGTFDLGNFTANRKSVGGVLTVANNATLKIGGTKTYPTNYTTNTLVVASTVEYAGTNQTIANQPYGNLALSSASGAAVKTFPATALVITGNLNSTVGTGTSVTFTAAAPITVGGNVSIGVSTTFNGGNYLHTINGNWITAGTFTGSTSTIKFTGAGSVISGTGASNFNDLTVDASQVSFSNGIITLTGNLATTGSGSLSQAIGGTLIMSGSGKTISGSGISIENYSVTGTISIGSPIEITGNLSVNGLLTGTAEVTMSGSSKTISGTGSKNFSKLVVAGSLTSASDFSISSNLSVTGSLSATAGTATFSGTSSLSGTANLFNTTLNGTSLQLSANAVLGVGNLLTLTAGTLDVTTSTPNTVNFNGAGAQVINTLTYHNLTLSNGNTKTASSNLTVNNSLTIGAGTTFDPGAFTHSIYNDWSNSGIFSPGASTIQFTGSATSNISGATTFNNLTINKSTAANEVILNSNITASTVNMTSGTLQTGSNTMVITSDRTGNGIIYGTITRTHPFTSGVAYAFKSPNNTILFSSVSGVSSITVRALDTRVNDFPFGGAVNAEYTITIPSGTYNATLRLDYDDDQLNGNGEASMGLWNYNGSSWSSIGKSANSTTSNYVEKSGLTSITNRWTLSDNSNIVRWNGSVSTDWHTPANWTAVQGSPSTPPTASDIVDIGTTTFSNQPTISTNESTNNIHIGSAQPVALTLTNGGSLTVFGNIDGTWGSNVIHTINVNNQTMTVNGDLVLSDGTIGQSINLTIGSGSVNLTGSLVQSGDASINFTGSGSLTLDNDFNYTSGSFNAGSGTIIYDGTENQDIAGVAYNNLTINKASGLASIINPANITGSLLISSGELDVESTTSIAGNVTIGSGTTLQNISTLHVGGDWLNSGTYVATSGQVIFDGSGTQNISATTFNNLNINKPIGSVAQLTGNIVMKGDLMISSGTLDIKTFDCNRVTPGGTITMGSQATLIFGGNNVPSNFSNESFDASSTTIANGTSAQSISGEEFGNLIFRNAGPKTLTSPIEVKGDLTIESGATFDGSSQIVTLNGNWTNNGTFTPSTSTLVCNGILKNITGVTTFNKLTVNGSYTLLNDITFNGLLDITASGVFKAGSTINTIVNGDLRNSGVLYSLGTSTFTGNVVQTLSLINAVQTVAMTVNFNGSVSPVLNSTSVPQFGFLNINNTGGVNPSVGWTVLYTLTVSSAATLNGGVSTHNFLGSLVANGKITSTGTINFVPSTATALNFGTKFSSTGTVNFGGSGAITIAGTPTSFAKVVISNTNAVGISPASNWIITSNLTVNSGSILNTGSYIYTVGGNISNSGTINSGTSTFKLNGAAMQDIYSNSAFNNLTINKASTVTTLSSDVTVNGVLTFTKGKIQTGGRMLAISSTGSVAGAASTTGWVNGKFRKNIATGTPSKTFEVGDGSVYTPVTTAFSGVTTAGDIIVSTTAGDHPSLVGSNINPNKDVNRYWTISNSGVVFTNYTATLNFVTADIDAGATTSAFSVARYSGTSWTHSSIASPNATNIKATGVTAFGDFAVGESCNAGTTIAFAGSPYCSNAGIASVTITGTAGGTFSSGPGLVIDASTGAVDLATSTAGSYVVNYSIDAAGGCGALLTSTNITISTAPSATISYTGNPYCSSSGSAAITLIGTMGGVFSSTTGLSIDPSSGTVDLAASTTGTYTVTYTIVASGGCSQYATSSNITITAQPFASVTYDGSPYCSNGSVAFPTVNAVGQTGTFTSIAGLSIDLQTGSINPATSTVGAYTVTYSVPASGGCAAYSNTAAVAINTAPTASISYNQSAFCKSTGSAAVTLNGTTGGAYTSASGLSIDATTGTIYPSASTSGAYTIIYSVAANGCTSQATTSVTISDMPSAVISYASPLSLGGGISSVNFSGTTGGTYSSTTGLVINSANGDINIDMSAIGSYTVTYTLAANGGCAIYSTTTDIAIVGLNTKVWDGGAGTSLWGDANNWNPNGVPTSSDNLTLSTANLIVINVDAMVSGLTLNNTGLNLTIGTGKSLTVANGLTISSGTLNANGSNLFVGGDWNNNGTFLSNHNTVTFNGTVTQNVKGSSVTNFYNISLKNTSTPGVSIESNQNLTGVLTLAANTIFDADGSSNNKVFTLVSTADKPTGDACIAAIPSGGAVTGNVTVQRFMRREGNAAYGYQVYRDISAPVRSQVSDLQNSIPVSGPFTGTSTVSGADYTVSSLQSFYEPTITDTNHDGKVTSGDGWTNFPVAANSEYFVKGQGYSVFIFGTDSENANGNDLWSLRGPINSGNVNLPVSYTDRHTTSASNNGWNLVGNPYPSTIDWTKATLSKVNRAVYFDDYSGAYPVMASWVNGVSANGGSQYIATGQGFWVKATGISPSVLLTENSKVAGTQTTFFREASPDNLLRVTLKSSNNQADETVIYFSKEASDEFDDNFDALKMKNQNNYMNLASLSPTKNKYAISAIPFSNCTKTVTLDVSDVTNGNYSLSFSEFESFPASMMIQLKDEFSKTTTDVRLNTSYSFTVIKKNAATYGSGRFSLVFTYSMENVVPLVAQSADVCNPSISKIMIQNSSSEFNYEVLSLQDSSQVLPLTTGTGSDLDLALPSEALVIGANKFLVKGINKYCSNLELRDSVSLTYLPAPSLIPAVASTTSCGSGAVTLTATGAPSGGHYNWYDSLNAVAPYPNVTDSTFITPVLSKSGMYYVSSVNTLGCEGPRAAVVAKIVTLAPASITVADLYTLESNYSSGNQWYLNSKPISGATGQKLKPTESGLYRVEVVSQGCTVTAEKEFVITAIESSSFGNDIKGYPNPTSGTYTVEIPGDQPLDLPVFNEMAAQIGTMKITDQKSGTKAVFDFSSYPSGFYYIRVPFENNMAMLKVIKL